MKLAVCAITYEGAHSLKTVQRHILDWELQSRQDFKLYICHDGPYTIRDRACPADIDFGSQVEVIEFPERRRFWGAYCRKDWLETIDPEEYPFVAFLSCDDQVSPKYVETVLGAFDDNTDAVMYQLSHWHYGGCPIPLGTGPHVNKSDWISGCVRTSIAQKAGINYPDEFAADGLFWQDCLAASGGDESRYKILPNILVFKN